MTVSVPSSFTLAKNGFVRFVLPERTSETYRELHEAKKLAGKLKGESHKLYLNKSDSHVAVFGNHRCIVLSGEKNLEISREANRLHNTLNNRLNEWVRLTGSKVPFWSTFSHARELRDLNGELASLSNDVSELNEALYFQTPDAWLWEIYTTCCRELDYEVFDKSDALNSARETAFKIVDKSQAAGEKERELFTLLDTLGVDKKPFIQRIKDEKRRAVNVRKAPKSG